MPITFYYGTEPAFAWRVRLALEHKALDYELKVLSFSDGDPKKPEFAGGQPASLARAAHSRRAAER